ncbi:MAG: hypothetical protein A2504_11145 [Bdellovibrionales bacterium RIFOXYD12_FULL_39_22]|nr:MAG: hypothetical protein A2385_09710 [Bdellovibrionales bacterium RIFOXYB1_FULL_39_21]OFZ44231.1 MAG: hypothetical protein A2485_07330 [Bdellovibrionales bacterium RIFOXYC12_FULL_39_17]OFZ46773.1 MAG: hypothetical protein A2404_04565 [Bdellovibrionales bacterium RIFOXYC1_FULL_39_130]OFZ75950.1 MAG: hypothetical protein A2560_02585 [Bdellovibrionales bacterium RIFOXYD1_FULL_39_84]OFZ95452.1 MAG: hypothetical protein A2504_11145 [Bdellovibrionales bacterium RIFOXYD12_FULL_39_22]HLE09814.1 ch
MADDDLVKLFIDDTSEALTLLERKLLELENSTETDLVNELFRAIHSIKGGAGLLEYDSMMKLAHTMENFLGAVREGSISPSKKSIDALLAGTDLLKSHLSNPSDSFDFAEIENSLKFVETQETATEIETNTETKMETEEKTEIKTEISPQNVQNDVAMLLAFSADLRKQLGKEDSVQDDIATLLEMSKELKQQLETVSDSKEKKKLPIAKVATPTSNVHTTTATTTTTAVSAADQTLRISVAKLNKLVNLAGELVLARNQLLSFYRDDIKNQAAGGIFQNTNRITTEIQTEIMSMRMQPISLAFNKFPRLVRDMAGKLGKAINVSTEGENVELDKTIIEAISDPLNHLVRNCADHGLETEKEREAAGKPREGKITLKAFHAGGLVHIEVSDDGRGIDAEKVAKKALEKGVISTEHYHQMKHEEKLRLIFMPGFSTAEKVTDLSGRGVGMDVVKTNIEKLGGSVDIETAIGRGSTVKISLPLTLAIISSLIVEVGGQTFAVPQVSVEELLRVTPTEFSEKIATILDGQVIQLRGELIPLMHLADCVGLLRYFTHPETGQRQVEKRRNLSSVEILEDGSSLDRKEVIANFRPPSIEKNIKVMVVTTGHNRFAVIVDKIIGFEEIIVKSLPMHLRYLSSYAGVTILGDGKVALIVDVHGIASKNRLIFEKAQGLSQKIIRQKQSSSTDRINILIFDNNGQERYAIPVSAIKRVDQIEKSNIQFIEKQKYLNYMESTTMIVDLEQNQTNLPMKGEGFIIIPKELKIPMALLIGKIVDTKEVSLHIEPNTTLGPHFMGTAIIDDKITFLLDIHKFFESFVHDCFRESKKRGKYKILFAEDTPLYQKMVMSYLKEDEHSVDLVGNGKLALERLMNADHDYDLLLTDIEMPEMSGLELTERLNAMSNIRQVPVIAITSLTNKKMVDKGMSLGMKRWLKKTDKLELLNSIQDILSCK